MAFKEITDLTTDVVLALGGRNKQTGKANPTKIEGYYLGKRQVDSKKSKTGKSYIYTFKTAEGNIGVWGKTDLDRKMQAAVPGTMLRVTQSGMTPTPNGDMYKYKVEVDDTNTIEVSAQVDTVGLDTDGSSGDEFDADDDTHNNGYDEEESTTAKLVAEQAARKAKVDALLGKGKAKN